MVFADSSGVVALLGKDGRQARHRVEGLEVMEAVLEPIHAVAVIVQTAENDGTTRTAAGGGAVGVGEDCAICRERIEDWRFDDRIAVAAQGIGPVIIRNNENNIGRRRSKCGSKGETDCSQKAGEGFGE